MKGPIVFITLFSLLLFASTIEPRHEPGEYWRQVMKDEPLPEAIKGRLIHSASNPLEKKMDCAEALKPGEEKLFVKDIEPRPNVSLYPNDVNAKESSTKESHNEKPFAEDIEPRPNVSIYNN